MVEIAAIAFGILLFAIPATTAYFDSKCYEQYESYVKCVSKSQERDKCEDEHISWYCSED